MKIVVPRVNQAKWIELYCTMMALESISMMLAEEIRSLNPSAYIEPLSPGYFYALHAYCMSVDHELVDTRDRVFPYCGLVACGQYFATTEIQQKLPLSKRYPPAEELVLATLREEGVDRLFWASTLRKVDEDLT